MTRLRADVQFGIISDNPLAIGATTVNSTSFSTLPTITGSDDFLITLDPAALYGLPEIVRVTAHTAAATVCTITRAQLGTSARQHGQGVQWVLAPYTVDVVMQCTSTTRPSVGLYPGLEIFETDTKRMARWTGAVWTTLAPPSLPVVTWRNFS